MTDHQFMAQAIDLARNAYPWTDPNPLVGSLIVKGDRIIGRGYHGSEKQPGLGVHSEMAAMDDAISAGESLQGATVYTTMEPCGTVEQSGGTLPCAHRLVESGVARVVIAQRDPYLPGNGIGVLKDGGVEVTERVLEPEALALNLIYNKAITKGRPFITVKVASTLDGRIATAAGHSQWITNEKSRVLAHRLRGEHRAILVGSGTVLADNPRLNVRDTDGPDPAVFVFDRSLKTPPTAKLFDFDHRAVFLLYHRGSVKNLEVKADLENKGARLIPIGLDPDSPQRLSVHEAVTEIHALGFRSLLVEGGAGMYTSFLKSAMVDQVHWVLAPMIIGAGVDAIADLNILDLDNKISLYNSQVELLDGDIHLQGYTEALAQTLEDMAP